MLKEQKDEHLMIQCEACEETMAEGKEELTRLFGGVDMGSHQEVFATFFNKGVNCQLALEPTYPTPPYKFYFLSCDTFRL
ncbi:hypothetical protein GN956_G6461 [Arapaima gigas]